MEEGVEDGEHAGVVARCAGGTRMAEGVGDEWDTAAAGAVIGDGDGQVGVGSRRSGQGRKRQRRARYAWDQECDDSIDRFGVLAPEEGSESIARRRLPDGPYLDIEPIGRLCVSDDVKHELANVLRAVGFKKNWVDHKTTGSRLC